LDYFKILGVNRDATDKEIKIAYRKLAKKYHPDTYKGDKNFADVKMKELNEAYSILSDETKRKAILDAEGYNNRYSQPESNHQANNYTRNNYVRRNTSGTSNYEEGSVYDFDQHLNRKYNQSYSSYNFERYVDENDVSNMYYIDFAELKRKLKGKGKIVIIIVLIVITVLFFILKTTLEDLNRLLSSFGDYSNKNSYINNIETKSVEDEWNERMEAFNKELENMNKSYEEWYNAEGKYYKEELTKAYEEWYNTEGKNREEELNKVLKELEEKLKNY